PRDLHVRAHGNRVVQDPDRNGGGPRRYRNQAYMRADFAGRRKHGALARREPPLCDETVFGSRANPWSDCKALKVRAPAPMIRFNIGIIGIEIFRLNDFPGWGPFDDLRKALHRLISLAATV